MDIAVILTGLFGSSRISMAVYNKTGKHRKQIRIDSSSLSDIQCKAIVGFHALHTQVTLQIFLIKKMMHKVTRAISCKKIWEKS